MYVCCLDYLFQLIRVIFQDQLKQCQSPIKKYILKQFFNSVVKIYLIKYKYFNKIAYILNKLKTLLFRNSFSRIIFENLQFIICQTQIGVINVLVNTNTCVLFQSCVWFVKMKREKPIDAEIAKRQYTLSVLKTSQKRRDSALSSR